MNEKQTIQRKTLPRAEKKEYMGVPRRRFSWWDESIKYRIMGWSWLVTIAWWSWLNKKFARKIFESNNDAFWYSLEEKKDVDEIIAELKDEIKDKWVKLVFIDDSSKIAWDSHAYNWGVATHIADSLQSFANWNNIYLFLVHNIDVWEPLTEMNIPDYTLSRRLFEDSYFVEIIKEADWYKLNVVRDKFDHMALAWMYETSKDFTL